MRISFETFPEKSEYQSLLVVNPDARWRETLYFTFYTPWGEEGERLYAGRAMADFHFKNKPCECLLAFDFHRWDSATLAKLAELELPQVAFEKPVAELLEQALEERDKNPEGFSIKLKG